MSNTLIGLTGPVWGTVGDSDILIENISENTDGDWEELQDGDGDIVAAVSYGDRVEISFDFTMKNPTGVNSNYLVSRGSTIALPTEESNINSDGLTLYVQNKSKEKSKGGWLSGSITAIGYPNLGT